MPTRKKTIKPWRVRKFLNTPTYHSIACVYARVGKDDIIFTLSDCNRQIDLAFEGYDKPARRNALRKAQLLIDTLTTFKAKLEQEFARRDDQ